MEGEEDPPRPREVNDINREPREDKGEEGRSLNVAKLLVSFQTSSISLFLSFWYPNNIADMESGNIEVSQRLIAVASCVCFSVLLMEFFLSYAY